MKIFVEVDFVGMEPSSLVEQAVRNPLAELNPLCGKILSAHVEVIGHQGRAAELGIQISFIGAMLSVHVPVTNNVETAMHAGLQLLLRKYVSRSFQRETSLALAA